MAIGDLYLLKVRQEMFGTPVENVFHYKQEAGTGDARQVAIAFEDTLGNAMSACQSDLLEWIEGDVVNLDDPADFFTEPYTTDGDIGGQGMPVWATWAYKFQTPDRRIRSGGKRIAGVSEVTQDGGAATPAHLIVLEAFATAMDAIIAHAGSNGEYRLMLHTNGNVATLGAPLTVAVDGVTYRRLSTQRSRGLT